MEASILNRITHNNHYPEYINLLVSSPGINAYFIKNTLIRESVKIVHFTMYQLRDGRVLMDNRIRLEEILALYFVNKNGLNSCD